MAAEADAEPAVRIECLRRFERPANDGRQGAARLRGRHTVGKRAAERHLREQLEGAATIREGAADRREAAVRRDEPFLDGGVATRALLDADAKRLPRRHLVAKYVEDVQQHRLNDEA